VLVVDDQTVNARLLQRQVQRHVGQSVRVDVAFDGKEAVAAVTSGGVARYALVFMDINMPSMDGLEATRRIRSTALAWGQPRVVAITGNATAEDRNAALEAGVDAFIAKPCSQEVIAAQLRMCGMPIPTTTVAGVVRAGSDRTIAGEACSTGSSAARCFSQPCSSAAGSGALAGSSVLTLSDAPLSVLDSSASLLALPRACRLLGPPSEVQVGHVHESVES